MSVFRDIMFFLGFPPLVRGLCFKCKTDGVVIDLGDGDYICKACWDSHVPQGQP